MTNLTTDKVTIAPITQNRPGLVRRIFESFVAPKVARDSTDNNSVGKAQMDRIIAEESAKKTPEQRAETEKQLKIAREVMDKRANLLRRLAEL